jgi:hypothetical protein
MSTTATGPETPAAEEVRSYILCMLIELAEMAEWIDDRDLAAQLRDLVWPPTSLNRLSDPARL